MFTLLAQATQTVSDDNTLVGGLMGTVIGLLGWLIRRFVKNARAAKALELLATAAANAVSDTWKTYTAEKKAAAADGKLTDEEAAIARKKAIEAAKAQLGDKGVRVVEKVFKQGVDGALQQALEQEYATFRQGSAPAAVPATDPKA